MLRNALFAAALAIGGAAQAAPVTFNFTQTGFDNGGTLTGMFTGEDTNSDDIISSAAGEISAFTASFTGNTVLPNITFDTGSLTFDLGDNMLNGLGARTAEVGAPGIDFLLLSFPRTPQTQIGRANRSLGGSFDNQFSTTPISLTLQSTDPSVVPLPAALPMLLGALGAIGAVRAAGRRGGVSLLARSA